MLRISSCFVLFFVCVIGISSAQTVLINGKVIIDDPDVEGIHVINKTASKFAITRDNGEFSIPATLNDTIVFSAIKYKPKEVIITPLIIHSKQMTVYLTELVNELDEVLVGKVLTGNLWSDVENSEAKRDINFYDVGIPGYTGKPFTQSERRLHEATTGGGIVPLNPIINAITGRTKMLKNQIRIERLEECLNIIKSDLSDTFFKYNSLAEDLRTEFFYYCMEDDEFSTICRLKNDLRTLEFLKAKLQDYKKNLEEKKE